MNKKMKVFMFLAGLILGLAWLSVVLPHISKNDFPTPPCVSSVWSEGLQNEYSVEVCK